jgi:cellulose synthase/poly-beta-1,6-N-acetylglucosamine synthase-like glycosyltransferase
MGVRTELLLDHPWSDHLTEDVEFQVGLAQRGVRVDFAPDALVKAEMPASLAASQSQHERWERGRVELARTQVPLLLERSRRLTVRDRWVRADTAMDLLVPPFSILVAASSLVGAASLFVDPTHMSGRLVRRLAAATVIVQVLHVLSGLIMVRAKLVVYLSLIRAPLLVVWKVRLWGRILVPSRKVEWTRTARNEATA